MIVLQGLGIHMHDDLLAFSAGKLLITGREEALGDPAERSDPPLTGR